MVPAQDAVTVRSTCEIFVCWATRSAVPASRVVDERPLGLQVELVRSLFEMWSPR
jgi:hypothetical protein